MARLDRFLDWGRLVYSRGKEVLESVEDIGNLLILVESTPIVVGIVSIVLGSGPSVVV